MNRIVIGSYVGVDSPIHRVEPFFKLLSFLFLFVAVLFCNSVIGYALFFAILVLLIRASRIGFRTALGGVIRMWPFYLFIFVMNALFFGGKETLCQFWILNISVEGILQGANVMLRLGLALVLGNLLTATTSLQSLIGGIACLIYPLKFIGVPTRDVAMILGVSIQFIPTLVGEADMIRKAQLSRGARFESEKLSERASGIIPLVIPVFLAAFRRADELSLAMEARGYRRAKKGMKFPRLTVKPSDVIFLLIALVLCAVEWRIL